MVNIIQRIEKQISFPTSDGVVQVNGNAYHGLSEEHNYRNIFQAPFSEYIPDLMDNIISIMNKPTHLISVDISLRYGREMIASMPPKFEMKKHINVFSEKEFYCLGYLLLILRGGAMFGNDHYAFQELIVSFFMSIFERQGQIMFAVDFSHKRPASSEVKSTVAHDIDSLHMIAVDFFQKLRAKNDAFDEFIDFLEAGPSGSNNSGWATSR